LVTFSEKYENIINTLVDCTNQLDERIEHLEKKKHLTFKHINSLLDKEREYTKRKYIHKLPVPTIDKYEANINEFEQDMKEYTNIHYNYFIGVTDEQVEQHNIEENINNLLELLEV